MEEYGVPSRTLDFSFHEEAGTDANFRTENDPNYPNEQRQDVISRGGLVSASCYLKDIIHGYFSTDNDDLCSIIVPHFRFESCENGHRIKKVEIEITFSPKAKGDPTPIVEEIYPDGYFTLDYKSQHETVVHAGVLQVSEPVTGILNAELKREKTVDKEAVDMTKVQGFKEKSRNWGKPNRVQWILRENQTGKTGVPTSMQAAIRLRREDMSHFQAHFTMKVTPSWLTSVQSCLKSDPKDDPVNFDPAQNAINDSQNEHNTDELGMVRLEGLSDVTVTTILSKTTKDRDQKWT
ncbi:uncharacterized protein F4812DRAFT_440128 [Daldinia caldariorum]|uniref:uncharacterized protein n=1 Tax=Daldinia caldariorum TaxID=326644 RepID=UPI0020083E27|nr:uncharacterized protein F4812DRAFT_440128 [Daldinia caldariorum]KAI1465213.1 hypothetical protein F4812DRAFT_440128 [Daldinia caldariorum]